MPSKKVQKADIIKAALEILQKEDFAAVTARRLAEKLNCSVQPIYLNFASMDELENSALEAMKTLYFNYMEEGARQPQAYKGMGLAYIRFAQDYPNYFKILFMGRTNLSPESFIERDNLRNQIIQRGMELSGFDYAAQKKLHLKVWIFTHGLATMVATGTVRFNEGEIEHLLSETVREIITGIKTPAGGGRYSEPLPTVS